MLGKLRLQDALPNRSHHLVSSLAQAPGTGSACPVRGRHLGQLKVMGPGLWAGVPGCPTGPWVQRGSRRYPEQSRCLGPCGTYSNSTGA